MKRVAALSLFLLPVLACDQAGGPRSSAAAAPPDETCHDFGFFEASGWETKSALIGTGDGSLSIAWASNVGFKDDPENTSFPHTTIQALPPDGIVVSVVEPRPYTGDAEFETLALPVRLEDGYFLSDQYEGQPATKVSTYVIDGWLEDQLLNVLVWLGSNQPTEEMRDAANEELGRLCVSED